MKKISKKYYIITIGCQMNKVDSERLAAFLEKKNFTAIGDYQKADVIIINTCGVRQSAEDRVYGLVNQIKKHHPRVKIVIAGCLSRRPDVQRRLREKVDIFLPINEMLVLPQLLIGQEKEAHFSLDEVRLKQGEKYLDISPKHSSSFTAYVPIGNGCNNFCSYCVVPYARGREVYRPAQEIIKEVKGLIRKKYKEIVLIAQNVNSYQDANYDFPKLLEQLIKIPGKFWLRFSSSHPKDMSARLIKILGSSDKVCSHLHLAVQSGDNQILKAMNRRYTAEHYEGLIKKVRQVKPGIAITTDVIVGFPGETKKQFTNTVKLFKKIKFDLAYIAQYSPRPGTVSYKMKDNVTKTEKRQREKELTAILSRTARENNEVYLNQDIKVLVEGKNKRAKYYGKTSSYKTVLFTTNKKTDSTLIGQFITVHINQVHDFGLEGELKK